MLDAVVSGVSKTHEARRLRHRSSLTLELYVIDSRQVGRFHRVCGIESPRSLSVSAVLTHTARWCDSQRIEPKVFACLFLLPSSL